MPRWRYVLIAAYVGFGLLGAWIAVFKHSSAGLVIFGIGFVCILVHIALERAEKKREDAERASWILEVQRTADDVRLDGYGISSLEELARYHDSGGRTAVLAVLRALPAGQRSLVVAANKVEPDAAWD
jgi:hypothetical protein